MYLLLLLEGIVLHVSVLVLHVVVLALHVVGLLMGHTIQLAASSLKYLSCGLQVR